MKRRTVFALIILVLATGSLGFIWGPMHPSNLSPAISGGTGPAGGWFNNWFNPSVF